MDAPLYYTSDASSTTQAVQNALMQREAAVSSMTTDNLISVMSIANELSTLQVELADKIGDYIGNIESMRIENDVYNTNMFMNQSMTMQEEQINELSEKARNHIMRLRQKYQLKLYDISYYGFVTTVLLYAIFILSLSGGLLGAVYKVDPPMMSPSIAWTIIGVIVTLYLIIVLIYVRNNSNRRKTDWDKYNFGSYGRPQQSCSK